MHLYASEQFVNLLLSLLINSRVCSDFQFMLPNAPTKSFSVRYPFRWESSSAKIFLRMSSLAMNPDNAFLLSTQDLKAEKISLLYPCVISVKASPKLAYCFERTIPICCFASEIQSMWPEPRIFYQSVSSTFPLLNTSITLSNFCSLTWLSSLG